MVEVDVSKLYAPKDFKPYWDEKLSEEDYHNCKTSASSSTLRLMLDSPKAFYHGFFLGKQKPHTNALRMCKIIHMATLEGSKFTERYVVVPRFTGRTQKGEVTDNLNCKEVKEKREKWFADLPKNAVVLNSEEERDNITGVIESIMSHPDAPKLFTNGRPEVSGFYVDEETGIALRVRLDFLTFNSVLFTELKKSKSCEFRKFGGQAFNLRYDFQVNMYRNAVKAISGVMPEIIPIVVVEEEWPHECAVYWFEPDDLDQAEGDYRRCLWRLDKCLKSNQWPQRQERHERIYTPNWFMANALDNLSIQELKNV